EMPLPRPTHLLGGDELGLLEDPDVLLHPGQRHAEWLGELADRGAAAAEALEDQPSGGIGEGGKRPVDWGILNHRVQYCRASRGRQGIEIWRGGSRLRGPLVRSAGLPKVLGGNHDERV